VRPIPDPAQVRGLDMGVDLGGRDAAMALMWRANIPHCRFVDPTSTIKRHFFGLAT